MTEQQTKSLVQTLTTLGLVPGLNTSPDSLCLTDDPHGGSEDETVWWIGWDENLGCWVAANLTWKTTPDLTGASLVEEQHAYRWLDSQWKEVEFQGW